MATNPSTDYTDQKEANLHNLWMGLVARSRPVRYSKSMQVASVDVQTQKYLTLLELSKAIASHRDLNELFHDIACRLRNLFSFRDLAVMLHDDDRNVMRSYFFEGCNADQWINQGQT